MLGSTVDTFSASVLVIWQSRVRCLGVACGIQKMDSSGDFLSGAMLGSTVDTCSASVLGLG